MLSCISTDQYAFDPWSPLMAIKLFENFYYLTHHENLPTILTTGINSWNEVRRRGLQNVDISDPGAQRWRDRAEPVYNRSIHDFAPLYINPKNPMLYVRRSRQRELVILVVSAAVLDRHEYVFTDGNAASYETKFSNNRAIAESVQDVLRADYWSNYPDGRRHRCAEVLIYPNVPAKFIVGAVCSNVELAQIIRTDADCPISVDRAMFF